VFRNSWIRRRLRLTLFLVVITVVLHVVLTNTSWLGTYATQVTAIKKLLLTLAVIHGFVTLLFNPWFKEGAPERAPGIVQNALVLGVFGVFATIAFPGQLLATSAVGAVIMGFAVQDTLSNFFAGLALQIDRPFKPGHWIEVGPFQGRVKEITWRATKIQTKAGNLIIVPNNIVGKEAINNYSEPAAPTRLFVEVGTAYQHPPNVVRDAVLAAMRRCPRVLAEPRPDVVMTDFGASALIFQARFWVNDFSQDTRAKDEVRTAIFYEFGRRQIEIPWPIQVEYARDEAPRDTPARRDQFARTIAAVPVFASLPAEGQQAIAIAAVERLFARGEAVVTEGEPGASMFVVLDGSVAVTVGADRREVAVTEAGGYFGEMSLLTGEQRTATVTAREDTTVLEIPSDAFGTYVRSNPALLEGIAEAATQRRRELDAVRQAPGAAAAPAAASLLDRMKKFFRIY
jgi:small-conductance mechanosensitive channel/CRP-like cAMP-binding protein